MIPDSTATISNAHHSEQIIIVAGRLILRQAPQPLKVSPSKGYSTALMSGEHKQYIKIAKKHIPVLKLSAYETPTTPMSNVKTNKQHIGKIQIDQTIFAAIGTYVMR